MVSSIYNTMGVVDVLEDFDWSTMLIACTAKMVDPHYFIYGRILFIPRLKIDNA